MSTFSELTDKEKENRFFEAASILCELIDEEGYQILHHDLGISDSEIREHGLLSDAVLMAHGVEIKEPKEPFSVSQMIKKMDEDDPVSITLSCRSGGYKIPVDRLFELSDKTLKRVEQVFAARVLGSHASEAGLEIVIEDVDFKILASLDQKLEDQEQPQQTGPTLQM